MNKIKGIPFWGFLGLSLLFIFVIGGCEQPVEPKASVNSVTVSPVSASVERGKTQSFSAVVTGTKNPALTVTWSVVQAGKHRNTTINTNGLLTVAAEETLETLTVRATSTVNSDKYGEATVTVISFYTVTFNANGGNGTVPSPQTVQAGSGITLPDGDGLSKAGYIFGGWSISASGTITNYSADSSYTPTGNIILYAKWDVHYTVTFSANNGSGAVPTTQTVTPGSSITLPNGDELSRTGYTFGGWNTNSSGTGTNYQSGESFTPVGNVTLYAKWDAHYTVTFNANNGSGIAPNPQTVQAGSSITLPNGDELSRTGYAFGGWNANASGTGTHYTADLSYTPTGNITLYAKWNPVIYTVTYNVNGGNGMAPGQQTVQAGSNITLPSGSGLSRSNARFGGWSDNVSGAGTIYQSGNSFAPTTNITFYAIWINTYTVTFNANSGSGTVPNPITVDVGSSVTLPNENGLSRTGYAFADWNTNAYGTGTNYNVGELFTPVSNTTLYAQWDTNFYTVTFNADGGTPAPAQRNIIHDGKVTEPEAMTRTGYTFGGWYKESGFTNQWNFTTGVVTTNIILYAKWDVIPIATDFTIIGTGTFTYDGIAKTVNITAKSGKSTGAITILYNGGAMLPVNVGTYTVTFNVAAVTGYSAASGLQAGTITINKAVGAVVSAPALNTRTHNNITINPVNPPNTGQSVEYGISISNNANVAAWQTTLTFSGLNTGTTYYIFAHSVGNNNYETGAASGSLIVTTLQTVSPDRIEYYWIDQHGSLVTTSGGVTTIAAGATLSITAQGTGYVVQQWHLNGKNTGQSGNTYNFSSTTAGSHTVGLFVEKDGKLYNTNITITVQ